jgi:hypothetical protein
MLGQHESVPVEYTAATTQNILSNAKECDYVSFVVLYNARQMSSSKAHTAESFAKAREAILKRSCSQQVRVCLMQALCE